MAVRVLHLFPPNYRKIVECFDVRGKPIIFAYGSAIYNPSRAPITPQLERHEEIHLTRQGGDPETWWDRYIAEPSFRLAEEIPAHAAEYQAAVAHYRVQALDDIAARLSSPLYGGLITFGDAREAILREAA
jgi:hypothetical protein